MDAEKFRDGYDIPNVTLVRRIRHELLYPVEQSATINSSTFTMRPSRCFEFTRYCDSFGELFALEGVSMISTILIEIA